MSLIPVTIPDVPVLWHNSVADVEPTSQYGLDRDLASVNSTLCYLNPSPEPLAATFLAPSREEVECNFRFQSGEHPLRRPAEPLDRGRYRPVLEALAAGGWNRGPLEDILQTSRQHFVAEAGLRPGPQVVRFHTRVGITPDEHGSHEFRLAVPMGAGSLSREAVLSVVVLLPSQSPDYRFELIDWHAGEPGVDQVKVYGRGGLPGLGGRPAIAWAWRGAPFVSLSYRYA